MKSSARRILLIVAASFLLVALWAASSYLRYPLSTGHGINYYTNYVFVYERQPRDCGFFPCLGRDLTPFVRDSHVWGADPFSFKYVGSFNPSFSSLEVSTANDIFRDKSHVIYQGAVVRDSDPSSLKLFDGYAKDKRHVYVQGRVAENLDPATFESLGCGFYRDKNGVYNWFMGFWRPVAQIDRDSFEVISPSDCRAEGLYTARDKNHLYKWDGTSDVKVNR